MTSYRRLNGLSGVGKAREVGRIGYYAPEIVIKNNLIHSINGPGYFHRKK